MYKVPLLPSFKHAHSGSHLREWWGLCHLESSLHAIPEGLLQLRLEWWISVWCLGLSIHSPVVPSIWKCTFVWNIFLELTLSISLCFLVLDLQTTDDLIQLCSSSKQKFCPTSCCQERCSLLCEILRNLNGRSLYPSVVFTNLVWMCVHAHYSHSVLSVQGNTFLKDTFHPQCFYVFFSHLWFGAADSAVCCLKED